MEIKNLRKAIIDKALPSFTIFTGNEVLMHIYLDEIYKNFSYKFLTTINDYITIKNSKFNVYSKDTIFIIKEDEDFKSNTSLWNYKFENVVLIYSNLRSSDKFYKAFEPNIVKFIELPKEMLYGVIEKRLNIKESDINWIMQECDNDYYKCLNEVEKISIFDKQEHQKLFNEFKSTGILCKRDKMNPFDLVNAVSDRNKVECLNLLPLLSENDVLSQLSLIYTNFKNTLLVRGGKENFLQSGVNPNLYNVLIRKTKYSTEELCSNLILLSSLINKIKWGYISSIDALNVFILGGV